jgi:hypothetical protein
VTATLTRPMTSLIGGCPKIWCLDSNACSQDEPGSLRYHEGRTSSAWAYGTPATTVDVTPLQFDEQDWTTYSGPMVTISIDGPDNISVDFGAEQAVEFSNTLARFAAGDVEIGAAVTFTPLRNNGDRLDGTLRLCRLDDFEFSWGDRADQSCSLSVVEIRIINPDNFDPGEVTTAIHGPDAAGFARYVVAAAVEVSQ